MLKKFKIKRKADGKLGSMAISQIIILVLGIIAISYLLGSEIRVVSAQGLTFSFTYKHEDGTLEDFTRTYSNVLPAGHPYRIPGIASSLPNNGDGFSFFYNDDYRGSVPGAQYVATNGNSVYYYLSGWVKYETADNIQILSFIPETSTSVSPEESSGASEEPPIINTDNIGTATIPLIVSGVEKVNLFGEGATTLTSAEEIPSILELRRATGLVSTEGAETVVTAAEIGWLKEKFAYLFEGEKFNWKVIKTNFLHAALIYGAIKAFEWLIPSLDPDLMNKLANWGAGGYFVGSTLGEGIFNILGFEKLAALSPTALGLIGLGVGVVISLLLYRKEYQETFMYNCYAWSPPTGGEDCDKCGDGILPCSKYECDSLGRACELLNEGTEDELCEWINRNDIDPATIEPLEEALQEGYTYVPDNTISPPDKGVIVKNTKTDDGCVEPYGLISFGVELDKPAACKYSLVREDSFEDMGPTYFSNGRDLYNHSTQSSLPGVEALEAEGVEVENEGWNDVYVRCETANGVTNEANFVFRFCISEAPDTMAPEIIITNPINNMPISYGETSINVDIYLNEPSTCKWDHLNQKTYENMEGSFTCAQSITEMSAQMLYKCTGTLTGLIDNTENKFYFLCRDKPNFDESERNEMAEPYEYTLIGTRPLVIDSIKPESGETTKGSSDTVKVVLEAKTSAGYDEGKANCYYNEKCYNVNGNAENYILFGYPIGTEMYSQYQHSQELWLDPGTYDCSIKCMDLGGNSETKTTTYTVQSDREFPFVVRIYHDPPFLRIITNEEAECVYDTTDCSYNFEDGISMTSDSDNLEHYTEWDTKKIFYIKCKDEFGTQPAPNYCSVIIRPLEI